VKLSVVLPGLFCAFLLAAFPVLAVSVSIVNFPSVITADPFTITASISGAASGTNYIRVDLYKYGTQNYFGETYNGSDWYGGSNGKEYFSLDVQTGKFWSGDVLARTGDVRNSDYDGQGAYKMRIRRYTSSGGSGSEDADNSSVSIAIHVPTPTPTPTAVPTDPPPEPTNTPRPTPTSTRTPTPARTLTPTFKPTPTLVPTASVSVKLSSASADVLGITDSPVATSTPADIKTKPSVKPLIISLLLVGIGCAILSLVFVWKKRNSGILKE
jgi:hypothetical protein